MANNPSQSETTNIARKNFFVPSFAGAVLFFILGTIMLLAYNLNQIVNWVGSNYLDSKENLHLSAGVFGRNLSKSFDTAFNGRLGQILVWSLVGALFYILIWFLKNMLNSFENDIIVDHYVHPKSYSRAGYWGSSMAGKIFFAVVLVLLVAYTYISLLVIMPGVAALASSSLNDFRLPDSILYITVCVIVPAVVIYLWTLILKTVSHLWKLL